MSTVSVTEWKHPTSVVNGVYLAATFVGLLTLVAFGAMCHALWVRESPLIAITSVLFAASSAALYGGGLPQRSATEHEIHLCSRRREGRKS